MPVCEKRDFVAVGQPQLTFAFTALEGGGCRRLRTSHPPSAESSPTPSARVTRSKGEWRPASRPNRAPKKISSGRGGEVEDADEALSQAHERERSAMADAYAAGGEPDHSATMEAETALARAKRRLADLKFIAPRLAAKAMEDGPLASSLNLSVEAAIKAVVAAAPLSAA